MKFLLIYEHMFDIIEAERGGDMNVDMISVCGADGKLTPIRFRMETENQCTRVVPVLRILHSAPIQYAGVDAIQYLCKALVDDREKLFELRYTLKTHCWSIFRVVY